MKGRSPETQALVDRFRSLAPGLANVITFTEIEALIHTDPTKGPGYSRINSAKRVLLSENNIVIVRDKLGYYRPDAAGTSQIVDKGIGKIQKVTFGTIKISRAVVVEDLTTEQKANHAGKQAILRAVMEAAISTPQPQLPPPADLQKLLQDTVDNWEKSQKK